jgi:glycosyltransferase involved in cell wall biosynthesis
VTTGRPRLALVYDRIYPLLNGGGERRFYEIGRRLAHEFEVGFFYYGQGAQPAEYPDSVTIGVGGDVPMYTPRGRRSVLESADFARRLSGPLSSFKPDLIDVSSVSYAAVPVCALVARRLRASLVITWHEYWGAYWSQYLPSGMALCARVFEQLIPRLASANVAVSQFTASRLRAGSGHVAQVVPNGIDLASISAASPSSTPTDIVFIGRLIKEKRVDLLLGAVGTVAASVPRLHLEIIGDGPERQAIDELVQRLPANVRVDHVARVASESALYGRIKSAKMLVLPSEREGYGLVVAEAQACGTVPVVMHWAENASVDLVESGETGIIAPASADGLARAITTLLRDADLRARIGQQARVASTFRDWEYSAADMSTLFRLLMLKKSTQRAYSPGELV